MNSEETINKATYPRTKKDPPKERIRKRGTQKKKETSLSLWDRKIYS